ncbi:MAG: two-component regulator propeller domain-containing protein [Bryobacteraceae bacterium]
MRRFSHSGQFVGFLFACLLLWAPSLFAIDPSRNTSQYVHRVWLSQPGLSQGPILAIAQDRDGFILLATSNGVVRFDGVRFSGLPVLKKHPLPDAWVWNLAVDSANRIWIRTNDGSLTRVSGDVAKVFTAADGLPDGKASCLQAALDGGVWVCTPTGLLHFDGDKSEFHPAPGGRFAAEPARACETKDHVLWMGGTEVAEIYGWDGKNFLTQKLRSISPYIGVRSIACTDDRLWVGTDDGLLEIRDKKEKHYSVADGVPDEFIVSLGETKGPDLWVGTRKGIGRFHNGEFLNYGIRDGLSHSTVYAMFEDREGSVWVATKSGLNQFLDGEAVLYRTSDGLPSNNMGPVIEDSKGQLWGGTLGGGLFRYDGHKFTTLLEKDGLASNTVKALARRPDEPNVLWVGTDRGLNRLRDGRIEATFREPDGLPSSQIRALRFDHNNVLWVGTARGVAQFVNGRFVPLSNSPELQVPISALGERKEGELLFSTVSGVLYLRGANGLEKRAERDFLRDLQVFYTDQDGYVWMGLFGGGLVVWKDAKPFRIALQDGLPDSQIFDILPDGPDRLWVACSNGYHSLSRRNLLDFVEGKAPKVSGVALASTVRRTGIESQADVHPTAWKSSNGIFWFATTQGLLSFDPARRNREAQSSLPVVDEIEVSGESVRPGDIEQLPPGAKNITLHYTALSFLHPEDWNFRYRLFGYDADWVNAGTRRDSYYTNLPPGAYRFEVLACETHGDCKDASTFVSFALAPYWYQRVWFVPGCVLAVGLMILGAYRLRMRTLRNQVLLVVGERNRIARELHDTLIQGFSGITMQLQALNGRLKNKEERDTLQEIIRDAGTCLQETRRSVAGLRAQVSGGTGLAAALAEAARQITEQQDVRLRLQLADRAYEMPPEVKYNLVRIAQEAVTNAVKHSGARTIDLALDQNGRGVHLTISDDGRGFTRDGESRAEPLHYGIVGMRERANQIRAQFQMSSAPGRGTTIRVMVPTSSKTQPEEVEETVL